MEVLDLLLRLLRPLFFAAAAGLAVVATMDWAVRTRRISPFNAVARFFRRSVDPMLAPVERRVVRAGGNPVNAPFWSLAVVVLAGILVLTVLDFLRGEVATVGAAASRYGAGGILLVLLGWAFGLVRLALIVSVISSWVRISPYSKWVRWAFAISEPILRPLRSFIPPLGMIDITPIVAYILLALLQGVVMGWGAKLLG